MLRPQLSVKTLLWLMAVMAAFLGGAAWQRQKLLEERRYWEARNDNFEHALRGREKEVDRLRAALTEVNE